MKKVGFVDYYISEWHANHYPEWIQQANEALGTDFQVAYAWAEQDVSPLDQITTDQWCENFGVERCATIEELCEKSDYIIVLAPSNPEKHLQYAEKVLPFGKRTYIDKTFAPDYETAKKIFDLGEKYNTAFFSSSALRYAEELKGVEAVKTMFLTASGSNFEEYIIHPVEMIVSLVDDLISKVKVETMGNQRICRVVSEKGREAAIMFSPGYNYSIMAIPEEGKPYRQAITSAFFVSLLQDIINFFETGKCSFDPKQTLEVMLVRDALMAAENAESQWISINRGEV